MWTCIGDIQLFKSITRFGCQKIIIILALHISYVQVLDYSNHSIDSINHWIITFDLSEFQILRMSVSMLTTNKRCRNATKLYLIVFQAPLSAFFVHCQNKILFSKYVHNLTKHFTDHIWIKKWEILVLKVKGRPHIEWY